MVRPVRAVERHRMTVLGLAASKATAGTRIVAGPAAQSGGLGQRLRNCDTRGRVMTNMKHQGGPPQMRQRVRGRGRAHLRLAVIAAMAIVAILTMTAVATAAAPAGALAALTGSGSCLGDGCAALRGIPSDKNPNGLVVSGGDRGHLLFLTGGDPFAIAVLRRDASSGRIGQLSGPRGCVVERRTPGCALLRVHGHVDSLQISSNGTRIDAEVLRPGPGFRFREALYARNPQTGAVGLLDPDIHRCLPAFDRPCREQRVRGVAQVAWTYAVGKDLKVATGRVSTGIKGLAFLHRSDGRWRQAPGTAGCATPGGRGGCARLRCPENLRPTDDAAGAVLSANGRDVYVIGGDDTTDGPGGGWVASFRRLTGGGLRLLSCVRGSLSEAAPTWITTLPHSSTILITEDYANQDDAVFWTRMFAATPGRDGALGVPRRISGNLGVFQSMPILAHDGQTLYEADEGGGDLRVFGVTPTAVTQLPAPYGIAYQATGPLNDPWYGLDDVLQSRDHRFMYVTTESTQQGPEDQRSPGIVVYAIQH